MSKMTIYPSGKTAAENNKQPQERKEMKTHACGKEGMQNPNNPRLKQLENAGLAVAAPFGVYVGVKAMGLGMDCVDTGVSTMNDYRFTQEPADLAVGASVWVGGAVTSTVGLGVTFVSAYVGTKMAKKCKRAYQNSSAKQKIDSVMRSAKQKIDLGVRKVGAFLSKGARRAVDQVRLTDRDTRHQGEYIHTVVPEKDGKVGHTYVNPVKKLIHNNTMKKFMDAFKSSR